MSDTSDFPFIRPADAVFTPVRFQAGYDMEEVDDFLDRAEFTLNGEPDPAGRPPLTARDVEQVRFTSRRFGAGYAEADVDTYLHEHLIPLLTGR